MRIHIILRQKNAATGEAGCLWWTTLGLGPGYLRELLVEAEVVAVIEDMLKNGPIYLE